MLISGAPDQDRGFTNLKVSRILCANRIVGETLFVKRAVIDDLISNSGSIQNLVGGSNITTTVDSTTRTATVSVSGTTEHSVLVGSSVGSLASIPNGTTGQVLTAVTGGDPVWAASGGGSGVTQLTGDTGSATPVAGIINIVGKTGSYVNNTLSFNGSSNTLALTSSGIDDSIIIGSTATNNGNASVTILGTSASVTSVSPAGDGAVAIGNNATVSGTGSGVAVGNGATAANNGVAVGSSANTSGGLTTGGIAIGNNVFAVGQGIGIGNNLTTVDNEIKIGVFAGTPTATCFIAGIFGATSAAAVPVVINAGGQLGTIVSSQRYKENIVEIDEKMSRKVLDLRPVEFNYKSDSTKSKTIGLIAEEVNKILPNLVVRKTIDGLLVPEAIKYQDLPVLLLAELKRQRQDIDRLTKIIDGRF